ncbi:hypothetical protein [Streptomyces sp. NPDC005181]|uniref:hypothetical protein n=1 Tax=Streptomyces sp. NPDC005181 TaxID=3156869 RepID=UPI0033BD41D5
MTALCAADLGFDAVFRPFPPSSGAADEQPVTATDTTASTAVTVPRTALRTMEVPCPRP